MSECLPREQNPTSLLAPGDANAAVLTPGLNGARELQNRLLKTAPQEERDLDGAKVSWKLPPSVVPYLANRLCERWKSYRNELASCQERFTETTVHEFRVASRRLLAQILMLNSITPGQAAEKARRSVKRGLKALSELRDLQVQRSFVERQLPRFPELLLLRDELQRRERRLEKRACVGIRSFRVRRVQKCILLLEQQLDRSGTQADFSGRVASAVAAAFADVVGKRQAIEPGQPATIHRTRVAFKKFRYMVESLSPEFTGLNKRDLRKLAYYQRHMGILQDLEILQQCLSSFVRKHSGFEFLLTPFGRYLKRRRVRALRSFLNTADRCYNFWPPTRIGCPSARTLRKAA